jgi:hypothetical protein
MQKIEDSQIVARAIDSEKSFAAFSLAGESDEDP